MAKPTQTCGHCQVENDGTNFTLAKYICDGCRRQYDLDKNLRRSDREAPATKRCPGCDETKAAEDFYVRKRGGLQSRCKLCSAASFSDWTVANPERYRETRAAWTAANLDKLRNYARKRRALELEADGDFTDAEFAALKEATGNVCLCCGASGDLAADHVIPITKGGPNDIANIQPLCKSCNSTKGNRSSADYRSAETIAYLENYVLAEYGE